MKSGKKEDTKCILNSKRNLDLKPLYKYIYIQLKQ